MTEDEAKQIAGYVINLSESQRYRATVQAIAGPALKILGLLALASVALGLVLNGTAFFTKSIPEGLTFVAKRVLLGMAIGGYAAYTLTRSAETPAGRGGVPRPVALALLVPLVAFPVAATILGGIFGGVVEILVALFLGLIDFGIPCVATTFLWSVLFLYVIRPWRLRRLGGIR